jgi:hypothetical protein
MHRSSARFAAGAAVALALSAYAAAAAEKAVEKAVEHPGDKAVEHGGEETYTKETWPLEVTHRPLTLATGLIEITAPVVVSLDNGGVAKPIRFPASAYYGVNDQLTVGVFFPTGPCVTGTDNGCAKFINDVGVEAKFLVVPKGQFQAALVAGLVVPQFSDAASNLQTSLELGAILRYDMLPAAVRFDPRLFLGLSGRSNSFNREVINLPVTVEYQANKQLVVEASVGLSFVADPPVGSLSDTLATQIAVGGVYAVSNKLDVGAEFSFDDLIGSNSSSAATRSLKVFANIRM